MRKLKYILASLAMAFSLQSCFDLDEETFDRLDSKIYYQNESSVQGVVSSIYNAAFTGYIEWFWYLQEFSADQIAWRTWNGGLWGYDEGYKYVLSTHTWTPQSSVINDAWKRAWQTIGLCNNAIQDFDKLDAAKVGMTADALAAYKAEVMTLRAWAYYNIFEIWGGAIPLNTEVGSTIPPSADQDFDKGCKKIFDFIATELDASVKNLPKNSVNRMNQAMNRTLKARLLLNANVFIKEDRYTECASLCQQILSGEFGNYSIAKDYRKIYSYDNNTCSEVIFAFAWEVGQLEGGWMRVNPFIAYNAKDYFNAGELGAWNCTILVPSKDNSASLLANGTPKSFLDAPYNDKLGAVYDRFDNRDIRKKNFIYDEASSSYSGMFLKGAMKANYGKGAALKADADRDGQDLVYVDQVGTFLGKGRALETVMSPRWGETNSGVRLVKYPVYPTVSGHDYREADEVEFRLSEVVFMLAECKLRAGDANGAKELVNTVRERYFSAADWATAKDQPGPGFTTFDADWLLSQWGLEFLSESRRRRTDLRRFDKFTQGQWWFFGRATDDGVSLPAKRDRKYEWFPLPQDALTANPKLVQNPAYR